MSQKYFIQLNQQLAPVRAGRPFGILGAPGYPVIEKIAVPGKEARPTPAPGTIPSGLAVRVPNTVATTKEFSSGTGSDQKFAALSKKQNVPGCLSQQHRGRRFGLKRQNPLPPASFYPQLAPPARNCKR